MAEGQKIYQVDLEELVEDYVWRCYKRDAGFILRWFKRRSDYVFDIRWAHLDFKHVTSSKEVKESSGNSSKTDGDTSNKDQCSNEEKTEEEKLAVDTADIGFEPQIDGAKKRNIELYFSEYENRTECEQKYKFTATRQTMATTKLEMQQNYTLGATTNLEVNLAEIVKIGAEFNTSYSVTDTKAEEFSKSLTWNIDTEIQVPRWNKAKATLYVYEMPSKSEFVVKTTIKLINSNKGLPVTIRRVKDRKKVHTEWITDLGVLFSKVRESVVEIKKVPVTDEDGDTFIENHIVLTTQGMCRNVAFKNQHVKVECNMIPNAPPKPE